MDSEQIVNSTSMFKRDVPEKHKLRSNGAVPINAAEIELVIIDNNHPSRSQTLDLVERVAIQEKHWPIDHYIEQFKNRSVLWAAKYRGAVIGAALVLNEVDPGDFVLRSKEGWPNLQMFPGKSVEIPFLLVDRKLRGISPAFVALCAAIYWQCIKQHAVCIELTLDDILLRKYLSVGIRPKPLLEDVGGGPKTHWGEEGIFPSRIYVGKSAAIDGLDADEESAAYYISREYPKLWALFAHYRTCI